MNLDREIELMKDKEEKKYKNKMYMKEYLFVAQNDMYKDKNPINTILIISYIYKTFKAICVISTVTYFIGMGWYIFCDLTL